MNQKKINMWPDFITQDYTKWRRETDDGPMFIHKDDLPQIIIRLAEVMLRWDTDHNAASGRI